MNESKSAHAFRTISEVSSEIGVPQHILRYWETRFPELRPLTRAGGRRYYRPDDVLLVRRIHHMLSSEGYTIKGVQKILKGDCGKAEPQVDVLAALIRIRHDLAAALMPRN